VRARLTDKAVRGVHARVADAASAFESRWTLRALRRVDPGLHAGLLEQQGLLDEAIVTGSEADIEEQGAAMCRGWALAARRMADAGEPDDAYLLGHDERTGLRVAIGDQLAARDRVREIGVPGALDENDQPVTERVPVIWITPDECASLLAAQQELLRIKGAFPGCEITDLYPNEIKADAA
jgi:hypothetical protein